MEQLRSQFHQHFTLGFFEQKFCAKLFCTDILRLNIFLAQEYVQKCAHNMLVKMTKEVTLRQFQNANLLTDFVGRVRLSKNKTAVSHFLSIDKKCLHTNPKSRDSQNFFRTLTLSLKILRFVMTISVF